MLGFGVVHCLVLVGWCWWLDEVGRNLDAVFLQGFENREREGIRSVSVYKLETLNLQSSRFLKVVVSYFVEDIT